MSPPTSNWRGVTCFDTLLTWYSCKKCSHYDNNNCTYNILCDRWSQTYLKGHAMVYHSLGFYPRFFSDVCGAHLSLLSVFCILLSPLIVFVQCLPGLGILHSWLVFGFCWRLLFKSNMNHESVNGQYMSCLFHEKIMECNLFPYWNMINIQVRLLKNKHISTILWRGSCWCLYSTEN